MNHGQDKTKFEIFISSRMREFADERKMLFDLIPSLSTDVVDLHAWVYEVNAPASDHTIRDNYLKTLIDSELYIAILGQGYGEWTVDEFNIATRESIPRHVYVLVMPDDERDDKQSAFIKQIQGVEFGIAPRYFTNIDDLRRAVKDSIEAWLRERLMHRAGSTTATFADQALMVENVPGRLIGREHLTARINPLLDSGESVLLRGFGGMGKTALAATVAKERIMAGKGAVLWQKLGSENPDTVFQALARPFNLHQSVAAAQSDDEKRQIIRQIIVDQDIKLVVLDDAWDGKTLNSVLRAIPRGIPILVTSRHRYGLRAIIEVGELAPDKALEILGYYANADYTHDRVAMTLCQHLGYHAFALEVAGRTIRADNLSPMQLLERVKDAPQKLKVPDEFADEGRATVADLITASLTMLDNETQRVFMAMGAFFAKQTTPEMLALYFTDVPPVSDEMVALAKREVPQLGDVHDDDIREGLQQYVSMNLTPPIQAVENALDVLARRGLVERENPTERSIASVRIHDLAYAYARATHDTAGIQRALEACITYTWRYNQPNPANFAALFPEIENFLGASVWAMSARRLSEVERFAWNLYAQGSEFLDYIGFYTQAITLLDLAAEAAEMAGDKFNQGRHLGNVGLAYDSLGQYDKAIGYYERILIIHRELGDRLAEGNDLGNLGLAYDSLGQYRRAIEYHEQALEIAHEIGDRRGEGNRLGNLGIVHLHLGEHQKAVEYHQQALAIAREIGDRRGEGNRLGNLGITYKNLGQSDTAIQYYQQALAIRREIGDRIGQANDLNNIAVIYAEDGDFNKALEFYEQARFIYAQTGAQHVVARVDERIANLKQQMATAGIRSQVSSPLLSDRDALAQALTQAYHVNGEAGVRSLLQGIGASEEIIQGALAQLRQLGY